MTTRPRISDCDMYRLLRAGEIEEFNRRRREGEQCNLVATDLSRLDLRELDARGLDMRDCYFRNSDLRGIDFRASQLEGASFAQAHISGCYFPPEISPFELELALERGTRIRYTR